MPSTPLMTFYISALDYDRPRIQDPTFVSNIAVRQRTYDRNTDTYETTQGNAFTIERLMPVPYKMTMKLDIWTSNTNQKMQLLEQMLTLFNPALEIQSTDNFIDWTSLSVVYQDGLTFSSRSIPMGTSNTIDVMTWKFYMPIWLSSSIKVKKLGVIQKIINNIQDLSTFELLGQVFVTPLNFGLILNSFPNFYLIILLFEYIFLLLFVLYRIIFLLNLVKLM